MSLCTMLTVIYFVISIELGQVYVARQKYDAIGNRSNRVLSFEKGEELEVLAPIPNSEWWEVMYGWFICPSNHFDCSHLQAISLVTGNRGEVPSSFLRKRVYTK